jgi:hypothetical protein
VTGFDSVIFYALFEKMKLNSYLIERPWTRLEAVGALLTVYLLYKISIAIYNAYLGPLSKFPGSKLAASTFWYETYFDVFKGHQYIWQIKKMHEQYGKPLQHPTKITDDLLTLRRSNYTHQSLRYSYQRSRFLR